MQQQEKEQAKFRVLEHQEMLRRRKVQEDMGGVPEQVLCPAQHLPQLLRVSLAVTTYQAAVGCSCQSQDCVCGEYCLHTDAAVCKASCKHRGILWGSGNAHAEQSRSVSCCADDVCCLHKSQHNETLKTIKPKAGHLSQSAAATAVIFLYS